MQRRNFLFSLAAASMAAPAAPAARWGKGGDWQWEHYGGDAAATRYAPLDQINQSNVKNLEVAWVHKCGDHSTRPQTTIETTPIVVNGVMYLLTPRLKTQALDAATGPRSGNTSSTPAASPRPVPIRSMASSMS